MTHFRGYQDFAIEPHYEKLGEVNMQSEIARRQKLKQGNNPWPYLTPDDLSWPHVTWYCQFILFEVNKIREKAYESYVIRKTESKLRI